MLEAFFNKRNLRALMVKPMTRTMAAKALRLAPRLSLLPWMKFSVTPFCSAARKETGVWQALQHRSQSATWGTPRRNNISSSP